MKVSMMIPSSIALSFLVLGVLETRPVKGALDQPEYYQQLFPSSDEYDAKILDPNTIFGSPYGGFSRATRSRLAALPLRVPDMITPDEEEDGNSQGHGFLPDDALYTETSDGLGRRYVCRVYNEDNLDPSSLIDSMFNPPKLMTKAERAKQNEEEMLRELGLKSSSQLKQQSTAASSDDKKEEGEEELPKLSPIEKADLALAESQRRLRKLEGVCTQIHAGWWSYEWCHNKQVTQFHISISETGTGLALEDVTSLGKFSERKFELAHKPIDKFEDDEDEDSDGGEVGNNDFSVVNKYAEKEPELARVVDTFINGDICDATGKPRRTTVKYFCCSDRIMSRYKASVLRNGNPMASKIASIVSLSEDPGELCSYEVAVCTPLMCEEVSSDEDDALLFNIHLGSVLPDSMLSRGKTSKADGSSSALSSSSTNPRKEESVRDILDRTLGKACIQSSTGGWWSYEYCHKRHVRQFHESITVDLSTKTATSGDKDVYFLGYYDEAADSHRSEDEWQHIVNTTNVPGSGSAKGTSSSSDTNTGGGGVAAYFEQEYMGGDVCDDADVTDASIKAGQISDGHIERASSVRYMCGTTFDIYVNEDSTCHYLIEVTVPALCEHPAFKTPVPIRRVIKCLSVEDSDDWAPAENHPSS